MTGRAARSICGWARVLRGRGETEDGDLARPERPSRCTLPITALRVMPPSSAAIWLADRPSDRSEEHTSELQSRPHLVCRLLLEKKKIDVLEDSCVAVLGVNTMARAIWAV